MTKNLNQTTGYYLHNPEYRIPFLGAGDFNQAFSIRRDVGYDPQDPYALVISPISKTIRMVESFDVTDVWEAKVNNMLTSYHELH